MGCASVSQKFIGQMAPAQARSPVDLSVRGTDQQEGHSAQAAVLPGEGQAAAGLPAPAAVQAEPLPGPSRRAEAPRQPVRVEQGEGLHLQAPSRRMTPAGVPVSIQPSLVRLLRPSASIYQPPSLRELAAAALTHNQAHNVHVERHGLVEGPEAHGAWQELPLNRPAGPRTPSPRLAGSVVHTDLHFTEDPLPQFTPYLQVPVVGFPGRTIYPGFENFAYDRETRTLLAPLELDVLFARHYELLKLQHFLQPAIQLEYYLDTPVLLPYTSPRRSHTEGAYSIMAANLWSPNWHYTDYAGAPRPYQGGGVTRPRIRHYRNSAGVLHCKVPLDRAGYEYTHFNTIILQALTGRFTLGLDTMEFTTYRGNEAARAEDVDSIQDYLRSRGITPLVDFLPGSKPNFLLKSHFYIFKDRQVVMTPIMMLSMAAGEEDLPLFFDLGNFLVPPDELIVADVAREVGQPPYDSPFYPPPPPPGQRAERRGIHPFPSQPTLLTRRNGNLTPLSVPRPEDLQGNETSTSVNPELHDKHFFSDQQTQTSTKKKPFKKRKELFISSASEFYTTTDSATDSASAAEVSDPSREASTASLPTSISEASCAPKRPAGEPLEAENIKSPKLDSRVSIISYDPLQPESLVVELDDEAQLQIELEGPQPAVLVEAPQGQLVAFTVENEVHYTGAQVEDDRDLVPRDMEIDEAEELTGVELLDEQRGFLNHEDDAYLRKEVGDVADSMPDEVLDEASSLPTVPQSEDGPTSIEQPYYSPISSPNFSPPVSSELVDPSLGSAGQFSINAESSDSSFTQSEIDELLASSSPRNLGLAIRPPTPLLPPLALQPPLPLHSPCCDHRCGPHTPQGDALNIGSPPRRSPHSGWLLPRKPKHTCDRQCKTLTADEHKFIFGLACTTLPEVAEEEERPTGGSGRPASSPIAIPWPGAAAPPPYSPPTSPQDRAATEALIRALERIIELFRTQRLSEN